MFYVNTFFIASALKKVPSYKFFALDAIKTNVIQTDNVLTDAIEGVKKLHAMGTSIAMMEKFWLQKVELLTPAGQLYVY